MDRPVVILSNIPSQGEAEQIAHALVEEGLAASVNIVPRVQSVFRWQNSVQQRAEWMLFIKTTDSRADAAVRRLIALHSYDLPGALILPVEGGSAPYLQWLDISVSASTEESGRPDATPDGSTDEHLP